MILSNANTYGGLTTVDGGALRITNAGALGTTAAGAVVNGVSGGTNIARLELSGDIAVTGEAITIAGQGNFRGALSSFSGTNEWAGNVTVNAEGTRIGASDGATLEVSGVIDSGANPHGLNIRNGLVSAGGGVILSGASTYLGDTTLFIGRLQLDGGDNRLPWRPSST
jgi:autotransporter-associated beta strand protein